MLSAKYGRARTRESHWAKVKYGDPSASEVGLPHLYIAMIHYFVLLKTPPGVAPSHTMRVAICDLYKCDVLQEGHMYRVNNMTTPKHKYWAVEVHSMSCKVMRVCPPSPVLANYFMQYITLSQS